MKKIEFNKRVKSRLEKCESILLARKNTYADDEDFLRNFKVTAALLTIQGYSFNGGPITPEAMAHIYATLKLQRWGHAIKLDIDHPDNWTDLINFTLLGEGCHDDANEEVTS